MKIESSSQKREMLLFLTTKMLKLSYLTLSSNFEMDRWYQIFISVSSNVLGFSLRLGSTFGLLGYKTHRSC